MAEKTKKKSSATKGKTKGGKKVRRVKLKTKTDKGTKRTKETKRTKRTKRPPTKARRKTPFDIGIDVAIPKEPCSDQYCPFHGTLPVRGQMIEGVVVSDGMDKTVVVKKKYRRYIPKYERYEWRTGRYLAHKPPCINAKVGSKVKIMECRPISKGKSFVLIEMKTEHKGK